MSLTQTIKRILREETKIPSHILRRYTCMDNYITNLENGDETIPVTIRELSWTRFQIVLTAIMRSHCEYFDLNYNPTKTHSEIMDVFGDRIYKWYKENNLA